jgi:hypothetical protein
MTRLVACVATWVCVRVSKTWFFQLYKRFESNVSLGKLIQVRLIYYQKHSTQDFKRSSRSMHFRPRKTTKRFRNFLRCDVYSYGEWWLELRCSCVIGQRHEQVLHGACADTG